MTASAGVLGRALGVPIHDLKLQTLEPVIVAVLDSGIDGSHPDLAGRVLRAIIFEADAEGNVTSRENDPSQNNDDYGHGTASASIIARIAPNARFIDVRVLGGDNRGSGDALIAGFAHAVKSEAATLNMSLASPEKYLPRLIPLCETAYRNGKIIAAARRNRPLTDEGYPAALIPCVGVGNIGQGPEDRWVYQKQVIEFAAHGVEVPIAAAGGGYSSKTGTSIATPIVSGAIALMLGAYPGLTPFEVKAVLKAHAAAHDPLPTR